MGAHASWVRAWYLVPSIPNRPDRGADTRHEKDIPTEQPKAQQDARVPDPNAHDGRTERPEAPSSARTLPRSRLNQGPNKARFQQILDQGYRSSGRLISISLIPGSGLLGVGTARAIGCRARRNRQRRRVQSCFGNLGLPGTEWDCVAVARLAVVSADFAALQDEVQTLFQRCLSLSTEKSASS
jgi:ribonuclease P protein component